MARKNCAETTRPRLAGSGMDSSKLPIPSTNFKKLCNFRRRVKASHLLLGGVAKWPVPVIRSPAGYDIRSPPMATRGIAFPQHQPHPRVTRDGPCHRSGKPMIMEADDHLTRNPGLTSEAILCRRLALPATVGDESQTAGSNHRHNRQTAAFHPRRTRFVRHDPARSKEIRTP